MKTRTVCTFVSFFIFSLICLPVRGADPAGQSDAERLQTLEKAVLQLQQRNAALENEVHQLKAKSEPFAPILSKSEVKATAENDGKTVFTEPSPPPVYAQAAGSEYKLTLGGYIQTNLESGGVSAFEGRFGANALKDRFRLRRSRITLTGDFAE